MIPTFEILPGLGVPEARFGEQRADHRARLGERHSSEHGPGSGPVDGYSDGTLMLSYDEQDRLASIEIAGGNALVDGVQVVDRPLSEVLADLRQAGISPEFVPDQFFRLPGLNVYLSTPAPDDPETPIESVAVLPAGWTEPADPAGAE
ncbi:hypothetical protein [Jidongwangia harbinensis]|uniref:hypothetical protein n=1 Tax=Jidongwangia harbinensis TaxID=2878561 RepID=UPI001CDA4934|nr:hypothetical protein [Jidongwangia harbinensis]MCA2213917.1 hypothetical protein [Jidongwangia harbinensis]